MLTELSLQHFKAHHDTRLTLDRFTVLVGPNGSGKTSALEAVRTLSLLSRAERDADPEPYDEGQTRQGAGGSMSLRCAGVTRGESWAGSYAVSREGGLSEAVEEWSPEPSPLRAERVSFLRLESRRLATPSHSDEEIPFLAEDGYGLATVLSTLKLTATARFDALQDAARRIVPRLRGLGFKRTTVIESEPRTLTIEGQKVLVPEKKKIIADELLLDFEDASALPAQLASEGTLLVLGILGAFYSSAQPSVLLLDDLDRALHPKAQRDLVRALRATLDAMPDAQIVATTHSPYLVDELTPDQVTVLGRAASGDIVARRLADHPKARLLDVLTTGELWAAEGEDWVAAG